MMELGTRLGELLMPNYDQNYDYHIMTIIITVIMTIMRMVMTIKKISYDETCLGCYCPPSTIDY